MDKQTIEKLVRSDEINKYAGVEVLLFAGRSDDWTSLVRITRHGDLNHEQKELETIYSVVSHVDDEIIRTDEYIDITLWEAVETYVDELSRVIASKGKNKEI